MRVSLSLPSYQVPTEQEENTLNSIHGLFLLMDSRLRTFKGPLCDYRLKKIFSSGRQHNSLFCSFSRRFLCRHLVRLVRSLLALNLRDHRFFCCCIFPLTFGRGLSLRCVLDALRITRCWRPVCSPAHPSARAHTAHARTHTHTHTQ